MKQRSVLASFCAGIVLLAVAGCEGSSSSDSAGGGGGGGGSDGWPALTGTPTISAASASLADPLFFTIPVNSDTASISINFHDPIGDPNNFSPIGSGGGTVVSGSNDYPGCFGTTLTLPVSGTVGTTYVAQFSLFSSGTRATTYTVQSATQTTYTEVKLDTDSFTTGGTSLAVQSVTATGDTVTAQPTLSGTPSIAANVLLAGGKVPVRLPVTAGTYSAFVSLRSDVSGINVSTSVVGTNETDWVVRLNAPAVGETGDAQISFVQLKDCVGGRAEYTFNDLVSPGNYTLQTFADSTDSAGSTLADSAIARATPLTIADPPALADGTADLTAGGSWFYRHIESGSYQGCTQTALTADTTMPYFIGGRVCGLAGSGLVLQNNGSDDLSLAADGTFSFGTELVDTATYGVTVLTQPTNPVQHCRVVNGSSAVAGMDVVNVDVECYTPFQYDWTSTAAVSGDPAWGVYSDPGLTTAVATCDASTGVTETCGFIPTAPGTYYMELRERAGNADTVTTDVTIAPQ